MKKVVKLIVILSLIILYSVSVVNAQSYIKGDFHQHTTYTDGSYSIGYVMSQNNNFGLDWWANSEHGGISLLNARVSGSETGVVISEFWDEYVPNPIIGTKVLNNGHQVMWRWQVLRDSSFAEVLEARKLYPNKTIIQSYEMNIPGHEHGSLGIIDNQFDDVPNCSPLSEFEYVFDQNDLDIEGGKAQGWVKSELSGHQKTIESLHWLKTRYPTSSYLIIAHPERKPQNERGYTIATIRDMNNAAPEICFGFESVPGHQRENVRGGYSSLSVGGGTYGGSGIFSAEIGGLWDALLTEGRRFWLFSNSDYHSPKGDFYPGEYQKNHTYTQGKTAQQIVDGLRSGNNWVVNGDLIDSLIFKVETLGANPATATMGETLNFSSGESIKITIKVRDPESENHNVYSTYRNPVLDHIDVIQGSVKCFVSPESPDYSNEKVSTTKVIARFDKKGSLTDANGISSNKWKSLDNGWLEMTLEVSNVTDAMYFRLRGTNHSLNVINETDINGNPLSDTLVGENNAEKAFADLWFYSNPVFVSPAK